jgi:hypothetical protein
MKLATEDVVGVDAQGNATRRKRSQKEIEEIMESVMPAQPEPQEPQEPQPQLWYKEAEAQGLEVTPKDKTLPPLAGQAQAILRHLSKKYGDYKSIPDALKPEYQRVVSVLRQYRVAQQAEADASESEPAAQGQSEVFWRPPLEGASLLQN